MRDHLLLFKNNAKSLLNISSAVVKLGLFLVEGLLGLLGMYFFVGIFIMRQSTTDDCKIGLFFWVLLDILRSI